MRALHIQVRSRHVARVLALAREHGARAPVALAVEAGGPEQGGAAGGWSIVLASVPNERTGRFAEAVQAAVGDAELTLLPVGALTLRTPLERVDERVRDVSRLSTLELVLSSLQSVGAWKGMLLYSLLAGVIAAYGLIFDVTYLLVAAMLINPMGAPALVSVVGVAVGDPHMFARGGLRFVVSLGIQALAALSLGISYGLDVSTRLMEQVASLSGWAVVVAMAAGGAGAQTQVRSGRDSLVSGTAAGFMVAAALAPPAATLGLAVPLGRWDYVALMAFLLLLQYLAIAAGGWLTLLAFGVRPRAASAGRGSAAWRTALAVAAILCTAGLVAWQDRLAPEFRKADLSRTALEVAREAVEQAEGAGLVESSARFVRPDLERYEGEALLIEITVEAVAGDHADEVEQRVREHVRTLTAERMSGVVPLVRVTVLPPAPAAQR